MELYREHPNTNITFFISVIVFCGIDNILQNIPHIQTECEEYSHNIVSPIEYCYGYE